MARKKMDFEKMKNGTFSNRIMDGKEEPRYTNSLRAYSYKQTQAQMKYYKYLADLCDQYGIEKKFCTERDDRKRVCRCINYMQKKLLNAGIKIRFKEEKNRYKFDSRGNVIDTATGKIVRKSTDRVKTH